VVAKAGQRNGDDRGSAADKHASSSCATTSRCGLQSHSPWPPVSLVGRSVSAAIAQLGRINGPGDRAGFTRGGDWARCEETDVSLHSKEYLPQYSRGRASAGSTDEVKCCESCKMWLVVMRDGFLLSVFRSTGFKKCRSRQGQQGVAIPRLAASVGGRRAWKLGSGDERGRQIGTGLLKLTRDGAARRSAAQIGGDV
jgi:hypothetical protein